MEERLAEFIRIQEYSNSDKIQIFRYIQRSLRFLNRREYNKAINSYTNLIEKFFRPNTNEQINKFFSFIHYSRARVYKKLKKWTETIQDYETSIELCSDQNSAELQNNISCMYFYQNDYPNTVKHAEKAIELQSDFQYGWSSASAGLYKMNVLYNSLNYITKSIELASDCWDLSLRGVVYFKMNDILRCFADYYSGFLKKDDGSIVCDFSRNNFIELSRIKLYLVLEKFNFKKKWVYVFKRLKIRFGDFDVIKKFVLNEHFWGKKRYAVLWKEFALAIKEEKVEQFLNDFKFSKIRKRIKKFNICDVIVLCQR